MRKYINVLFELNKGTWIKNLSMFLCVILAVEGLWLSCEVPVMAHQEKSCLQLSADLEELTESSPVLYDEESDLSGTNVSGNELEDVYPEVRYDFCDIDYSYYANEQVNPQVYASSYLSEAGERLERAGKSVGDRLYDPYISNPSAVTAVRHQGETDTCWAFSTTAAAEVSAIRQGLSNSSQWYSPYHMAYFMYHRVADPLGGTTGDTNIVFADKSPDFLMGGGNLYMSLFYLSSLGALVKEEKAPFDQYVSQGVKLDDTMAYDADLLMKNGYMLSTEEKQIQDFKQAIVEYGAVAVQFRAGDQFKNELTGAYYCNLTGSNHAAVIVGWDDTYSRENFRESCRPSSDGAWIIKNSYGTSNGRDGYNYLSYEDKGINYPIAMELMEPDTYDNNYHYDGCFDASGGSVINVESGGQVANVFQAHASTIGYDESLEAVSIALKSTDVRYKLYIYKNLEIDESGVVKPSSGELMLIQEGQTGRAGVYTIPLEQSVCLSAGDTFSIVFSLEKDGGENITIWAERDYDNNWVTGNANIQKNQSFRRLTLKHTWLDLSSITYVKNNDTKIYGGLAKIKAFTNTLSTITSNDINEFEISVSMNSFVADGTAKCPEVSVSKGTKMLTQGIEYEVEYLNNIEPGEGQIIIKGISPYTGTVTIPIYLYEYTMEQCQGHDFDDTKCVLCGYLLKEQKLEGSNSYTKNLLDDAFQLDVFGNVTDLSYQSDNEKVAVVDENGLVKITGIGTANIKVHAQKNKEYQGAYFDIQIQVQKAQITEVDFVEENFYYNGSPQQPTVVVKNKKGQMLTQGKDYTLQYTNNNKIGNATVLVTGIGDYTGILKQNFAIQQIPQELCSHTYLGGFCRICGYERKIQQISGTLVYEKLYSDKGFWLDSCTTGNGTLTYSSNDSSVVTVDEKGYVSIHGIGIAYIYVRAKETNLYYANAQQVLVEILPGKPEIWVTDSKIVKSYGSKSFSLKAKANSDGKMKYKSSNKKVATISSKGKVSIKGYGKTTFTITTAETDLYEKATKKVTMTVVPKKGVLSKVKAKGGGSVSLTWKKNETVEGYQIQYSTSKSFKKSVKTKKIKDYTNTNLTLNLKKNKTYYFRVRGYKKVGKKMYYGSYSNVKKVKVK